MSLVPDNTCPEKLLLLEEYGAALRTFNDLIPVGIFTGDLVLSEIADELDLQVKKAREKADTLHRKLLNHLREHGCGQVMAPASDEGPIFTTD